MERARKKRISRQKLIHLLVHVKRVREEKNDSHVQLLIQSIHSHQVGVY